MSPFGGCCERSHPPTGLSGPREVLMKKVDPVVDEAIETTNMKDGPTRRRLLGGAGLFSATAAASALISACTSSSTSSAASSGAIGAFPKTPGWQFWFVNHADT